MTCYAELVCVLIVCPHRTQQHIFPPQHQYKHTHHAQTNKHMLSHKKNAQKTLSTKQLVNTTPYFTIQLLIYFHISIYVFYSSNFLFLFYHVLLLYLFCSYIFVVFVIIFSSTHTNNKQ